MPNNFIFCDVIMSVVGPLMHKISDRRGECNFTVILGHSPVALLHIKWQYSLLATSTGAQVIRHVEFFTDINNPVLHVLPFRDELTEHGG